MDGTTGVARPRPRNEGARAAPSCDPTALCDNIKIMHALYRKRFALPSLVLIVVSAGCGEEPHAPAWTEPVPDNALEAMQEAEALRHSIEEQRQEQRRLEKLLGPDQAPAR